VFSVQCLAMGRAMNRCCMVRAGRQLARTSGSRRVGNLEPEARRFDRGAGSYRPRSILALGHVDAACPSIPIFTACGRPVGPSDHTPLPPCCRSVLALPPRCQPCAALPQTSARQTLRPCHPLCESPLNMENGTRKTEYTPRLAQRPFHGFPPPAFSLTPLPCTPFWSIIQVLGCLGATGKLLGSRDQNVLLA
jgi:hypothetical protein